MSKCYQCDGNGTVTCNTCDGSGKIRNTSYLPGLSEVSGVADDWEKCYKCNGSGEKKCDRCHGSGRSSDD